MNKPLSRLDYLQRFSMRFGVALEIVSSQMPRGARVTSPRRAPLDAAQSTDAERYTTGRSPRSRTGRAGRALTRPRRPRTADPRLRPTHPRPAGPRVVRRPPRQRYVYSQIFSELLVSVFRIRQRTQLRVPGWVRRFQRHNAHCWPNRKRLQIQPWTNQLRR